MRVRNNYAPSYLLFIIRFYISNIVDYMERNVPKYGYHKKWGKKEETLTEKMTRSLDKRHTQIHGSLIETYRWSEMSFSIRRE